MIHITTYSAYRKQKLLLSFLMSSISGYRNTVDKGADTFHCKLKHDFDIVLLIVYLVLLGYSQILLFSLHPP